MGKERTLQYYVIYKSITWYFYYLYPNERDQENSALLWDPKRLSYLIIWEITDPKVQIIMDLHMKIKGR